MIGGDGTVATCSASLIEPGVCCEDGCSAVATMAVLDVTLVEHIRCLRHTAGAENVASKPLQWSPAWAPE